MIKKYLFAIMACLAFVFEARAIAPPIIENFDGDVFPPTGWTQQSFAGTQSWTKSTNPTMYIGKGSAYAMISSVSQTALVSPDILLPTQGSFNLKFFTKFMFIDPSASFEVWISSDGRENASDFKVLKTLHGDNEISDKEWKEISIGIPESYNGKEICFAFVTSTDVSGFYAWSVDEVELTEVVDTPLFYGEESLVGNIAYNNLPFPSVTGYEIKNKGGSPLTINSLISATPGLHLSNLPLAVEPGAAGILNVELDASGASLPVGPYNGSFTVATNDPDRPEITVAYNADVESMAVSKYENETFDYSSGLPDSWSVAPATGVYAFSVQPGRGIDGGNALNASVMTYFNTVSVRTGYVEMGDMPRLGFAYRFTDSLNGEAAASDQMAMTVRITDDGGFTWDTVYQINAGDHSPSAEFSLKDLDLSAYAGEVCMAEIEFTLGTAGASYSVDLDNISIGTAPACDLAALGISGNTIPSVGSLQTYTVTVINNGRDSQPASSWSVELYNDRDERVAHASGTDIQSGESVKIGIPYSFGTVGSTFVYGKVELDTDENSGNNATTPKNIYVQPADITTFSVGDSSATDVSPVNFTQSTSLSQSLYLPEEIGCDAALVSGIVYKSKLAGPHHAEHIKVWMGETDKTDYSDYQRVNPSDLTLVFDGEIDFSGVDGDAAVINFDKPYQYNGKTLVTYVFRPLSEPYSSSDCFYGFSAQASRTFVTGYVFSEINPMDQYAYMQMSNIVPDIIILTPTQYGSVSGVVSDENGPVADAEVVLSGGNLSTVSDAEGRYSFLTLTEGAHEIVVSKNGYLETSSSFTVKAGEFIDGSVTIAPIVGYPLEGTVTDRTTGNPVAGAVVALRGYADYTAESDENGRYKFPDIYTGEYDIVVSAGGYKYWFDTVDVTEAAVFDIVLVETPYPVSDVNVRIDDGRAVLNWAKPEAIDTFRYDSGQVNSETGFANGTQYGVFGNVYRENAVLTSVSWYLTGRGGDREKVNVYVFALDENGMPMSDLYYYVTGVPTTTNGWSNYIFPAPVETMGGFYVAIGCDSGFLSLGTSDPTENYPFVPLTQFYSGDYRSGNFVASENPAIDGTPGQSINYMVRAQGISGGKIPYSPSASLKTREPQPETYLVYRLESGMPQGEWERVGETIELSYADNWNELADGKIYQYAVVARYAEDNTSDPTLSDSLPKGMEVKYSVNLATNSGHSVEGAVVTLTNIDNDSSHVYTMTAENEKVVFPAVWRGVYGITIDKTGFNVISENGLNILNPGSECSYTLVETINEPYNLNVAVEGANATFTWNNASESFYDDMESYEDFVIDNIGDYQLYDGDRQPSYWFSDIYFSNMGYVGSWIVMNPLKTTPESSSRSFFAHSGNKYLACLATRTDTPNDDWLILPKVKVNNGSMLRFYAQNFTVDYDLARYKIGVSVTGTSPEDFTIISDNDYEEAPYGGQGVRESWEERTYDLSEFAGHEAYIAIACVSDDKTSILMIDDIEVVPGEETTLVTSLPDEVGDASYTVYIDGKEEMAGIRDKKYVFTGLEKGMHTAGVKSVYRTGESVLLNIDFSVDYSRVGSIMGSPLKMYMNSSHVLFIETESEINEVILYDMQGQAVYECLSDVREVDMSQLPAGVYMVRIATSEGVHTGKFFK